jgi:hypothetical protein
MMMNDDVVVVLELGRVIPNATVFSKCGFVTFSDNVHTPKRTLTVASFFSVLTFLVCVFCVGVLVVVNTMA